MPWATIGKATVWLMLTMVVYVVLRIAELETNDDSLRGLYRALVQMEIIGGLYVLVFGWSRP